MQIKANVNLTQFLAMKQHILSFCNIVFCQSISYVHHIKNTASLKTSCLLLALLPCPITLQGNIRGVIRAQSNT